MGEKLSITNLAVKFGSKVEKIATLIMNDVFSDICNQIKKNKTIFWFENKKFRFHINNEKKEPIEFVLKFHPIEAILSSASFENDEIEFSSMAEIYINNKGKLESLRLKPSYYQFFSSIEALFSEYIANHPIQHNMEVLCNNLDRIEQIFTKFKHTAFAIIAPPLRIDTNSGVQNLCRELVETEIVGETWAKNKKNKISQISFKTKKTVEEDEYFAVKSLLTFFDKYGVFRQTNMADTDKKVFILISSILKQYLKNDISFNDFYKRYNNIIVNNTLNTTRWITPTDIISIGTFFNINKTLLQKSLEYQSVFFDEKSGKKNQLPTSKDMGNMFSYTTNKEVVFDNCLSKFQSLLNFDFFKKCTETLIQIPHNKKTFDILRDYDMLSFSNQQMNKDFIVSPMIDFSLLSSFEASGKICSLEKNLLGEFIIAIQKDVDGFYSGNRAEKFLNEIEGLKNFDKNVLLNVFEHFKNYPKNLLNIFSMASFNQDHFIFNDTEVKDKVSLSVSQKLNVLVSECNIAHGISMEDLTSFLEKISGIAETAKKQIQQKDFKHNDTKEHENNISGFIKLNGDLFKVWAKSTQNGDIAFLFEIDEDLNVTIKANIENSTFYCQSNEILDRLNRYKKSMNHELLSNAYSFSLINGFVVGFKKEQLQAIVKKLEERFKLIERHDAIEDLIVDALQDEFPETILKIASLKTPFTSNY